MPWALGNWGWAVENKANVLSRGGKGGITQRLIYPTYLSIRMLAGQGPNQESPCISSPTPLRRPRISQGKRRTRTSGVFSLFWERGLGNFPLPYRLFLYHCAQPSHPTSCPCVHGGGGAGLAGRKEMPALATLVMVVIDAPTQGWPQHRPLGREDTRTYGLPLQPHPGPCWTMQQPSMA